MEKERKPKRYFCSFCPDKPSATIEKSVSTVKVRNPILIKNVMVKRQLSISKVE